MELPHISGQICWQVHQLREVWQTQRPKLKRLSCDSFVLSIKVHHDRHLYCGLNNGTLQLWDLQQKMGEKLTDKEVHDKGVKVGKSRNNQFYRFSVKSTSGILEVQKKTILKDLDSSF